MRHCAIPASDSFALSVAKGNAKILKVVELEFILADAWATDIGVKVLSSPTVRESLPGSAAVLRDVTSLTYLKFIFQSEGAPVASSVRSLLFAEMMVQEIILSSGGASYLMPDWA